MRLHSKRYSMRAAARLPFRRENRLYRQNEKNALRRSFLIKSYSFASSAAISLLMICGLP